MITVLSIRYIEDAVLFGFDLHWIPASIVRGASEGFVVALVGITAGAFIPPKETRKNASIVITLILSFFVARTLLTGLPFKDYGGLVLSRRDVFALPSVLFFIILTVFNLFWYFRLSNPSSKVRMRFMYLAIMVFSTIWSIAQYVANVRWVEVDLTAAPLATILVFIWDIVFEVAMCYTAFYTIPQTLGLIDKEST